MDLLNWKENLKKSIHLFTADHGNKDLHNLVSSQGKYIKIARCIKIAKVNTIMPQ